MDRWNERVKQDVPADRLLVWEPREGWGPLCEFLEVAVPDEPLPNVNDTAAFKEGILGGAIAVVNEWWDQRDRPPGAARGRPRVIRGYANRSRPRRRGGDPRRFPVRRVRSAALTRSPAGRVRSAALSRSRATRRAAASGVIACSAAAENTATRACPRPRRPVRSRLRGSIPPSPSRCRRSRPPALTTKSGAHRIPRAWRASATASSASWLFAGPAIAPQQSWRPSLGEQAAERRRHEQVGLGAERVSGSAQVAPSSSASARLPGSMSVTSSSAPSAARRRATREPTWPSPMTATRRPDTSARPERSLERDPDRVADPVGGRLGRLAGAALRLR